MSDRDDRDLTGAWALDALTPEARADFERYLESDDDARAEATELSDTAVLLGLAVPAETPPAALRARVLAAVDGVPQTTAETDPIEGVDPDRVPENRIPAGEHLVRHRMVSTGRRLRFTRRTAALLASSLVVLALLIVGGVAVRTTLVPSESTQAVAQIRDASDARTAISDIAGGGTAAVTWSDDLQRSMLAVDDLAAAPSNRVYQLWYIDRVGYARSAGLLRVGATGTTTVALDGRMHDGDAVGVTVEPSGGSEHPTTEPIVTIQTA